MKVHWCVAKDGSRSAMTAALVNETCWSTACGLILSEEEAEAGRGSPNASDATCGSCRRVAAAQVELRLTEGVLQEIPF